MSNLFVARIISSVCGMLLLLTAPAAASPFAPDFRTLALGLSAPELPTEGYDVFACGSDGGPPLAPITGWIDFAQCAPDARGLHEVYVGFGTSLQVLSDRVEEQFDQAPWYKKYAGSRVAGFAVVMSILFDDSGIARGFRVVTDQRAGLAERAKAYLFSLRVKPRYGAAGWDCTDRPPTDGRTPVGKVFIDQLCTKATGGKLVTVESHLFRKRGQTGLDINGRPVAGEFESLTRWEIWDRSFASADQVAEFLAGATQNCPGCDLSNRDFSHRDLSQANLSKANLTNSRFFETDLRDAVLSGAQLTQADFSQALLGDARLDDTTLDYANFYRANLTGADLSGARGQNTAFGRTNLVQARLDHVQLFFAFLEDAALGQASLVDAQLSGSRMRGVVLTRNDLSGAILEGVDLSTASLRGANLRGAMLCGSDFANTDFTNADLTGADLSQARLLSASLLGAKLEGAIFSETIMPDGSTAKPIAAATKASPHDAQKR